MTDRNTLCLSMDFLNEIEAVKFFPALELNSVTIEVGQNQANLRDKC